MSAQPQPFTNFKPAKGSHKRALHTRKEARRRHRDRAKRQVKLAELWAEKTRRIETFDRDGGRCRAYGVRLKLVTDDPFVLAHCHHFVYKSAGGSDEVFNRVTLSPEAHEHVHKGCLKLDGEPNGTLTFTLRDLKGRIVRVWDSAVTR